MKLVFCQLTYFLDIKDAIRNIVLVTPYVDNCIIVYDQTLSHEYMQTISDHAILSPITWDSTESVVKARNQYLNEARKLHYDWIIASDPDEHYDLHFLQNARTLLEKADKDGYNCLKINVKDLFPDDPNPHLIDTNFWKVIIMKCDSDVYIDGAGITRNRHEIPKGTLKVGTLPREYFYVHERTHAQVLERAFRNIYVAGGGDGFGYTNPLYVELKSITDSLSINLWYELREYMIKGNIDQRLKDYIIKYRSLYGERWMDEFRDTFRWYFQYLHKEENVDNLTVNPPPEVRRDWAEQIVWDGYLSLLDREADESGYKHYVGLLRNGQLNKETFEQSLKASDEYRNRI